MAREIGLARGRPLARRQATRVPHEGEASERERVVARLGHEQARARIGGQVLRVHRERADEQERPAPLVRRIGHDRDEGMARVTPGERAERAGAPQVHERARLLGERGLGRARPRGRPALAVAAHAGTRASRSARRPALGATKMASGASRLRTVSS